MFEKLRRKIAGWIIGDQLALYVPKRFIKPLREEAYGELPDDVLATVTRHFFALNMRIGAELADERKVSIGMFTMQQSVSFLVAQARQCGAESLVISQACLMRDESVGNWRVEVTRLPDDHDFGTPGVQETWDGDKLTSLSMMMVATEGAAA